MPSRGHTSCDRSSRRGSVHFKQLRTSLAAGGPASALGSIHPILHAQRLGSSQPLNGPESYRGPSPDSVFPRDGRHAGSLQNPLYDAGSPNCDPPVREHHYIEEEISQGQRSNVSPEETRIDPPRVKHTKTNEQAITLLAPHLQSMIRHYGGDSEEIQLRFLELVLKYRGEICRLKRKERTRGSGGVESLACLLCPPTSDDETVLFKKANAVRSFAEHITHTHLHIANPFTCFDSTCARVFPYSQDRDRHEKQIHKMYRPKAYEAFLKKAGEQNGKSPVSIDDGQSPIESNDPTESNAPQTAPLDTHLAGHRMAPYIQALLQSSPPRASREGGRNVTQPGSFNDHNFMSTNGIHDPMSGPSWHNNYLGRPGTRSHVLPSSAPHSYPDFDMTHVSPDGRMESHHRHGGIQSQMRQYYSPPAVPQIRSNAGPHRLINPTTASVIRCQGPSTNLQPAIESLQSGTRPPVHVPWEPQLGRDDHKAMYNSMQYQHDSYAISGLAQPQSSFNGHGRPTGYQAHQQQPHLRHGILPYGDFQQSAPTPTPSSTWQGAQGDITAMSFMTQHPAQVPGPEASSYIHYYPPIAQAHDTNTREFNAQMNHGLSRFPPSNNTSNTSHYPTNGTTRTPQYHSSYNNNTNNFGSQW